MLDTWGMFKAPAHRNNNLRNLLLSSSLVNSISSKHRAFLSLQIVHIRHKGAIRHTSITILLPTKTPKEFYICKISLISLNIIFNFFYSSFSRHSYNLQVEKIFGPGNQYVTAAKMILQVCILIMAATCINFDN
jgi:hypothetical protein